MIYVPILIVIGIAIVIAPTSGKGRRKSKGFIATLLDGQLKTEKRNNSHRGVMCGPGGSKRRK